MYIRRLSAVLVAAQLIVAAPVSTSSSTTKPDITPHTTTPLSTTHSTTPHSPHTKPTTSSTMTTTTSSRTTTQTSAHSSSAAASEIWQPKLGTTWQYVLNDKLTLDQTVEQFDVWDIDLFDNTAATVSRLHARGRKAIAYFSAGTWEDWRADASKFVSSDLGDALDDWPGEKWLDTRSAHVRQLMLARLDLAVLKGFDGVDPDNMDGYDNDNGLGLTSADATSFALFLAQAAHARGLSIGLKNAAAVVPAVVSQMQWSVQEQAIQYQEESKYVPFIRAGKPVFNVEYPKGDDADDADANTNQNASPANSQRIFARGKVMGFSTIIKNVKLDQWIQTS